MGVFSQTFVSRDFKGKHSTIMKWLDNFINRPITNVFRIYQDEDYEYYQPHGIFFMFDNENGLLLSAINNGISITLEAATYKEVYDFCGCEFSETIIQEVRPRDELNSFIGHALKVIKVGVYDNNELLGDNFVIKQGKYAGVIISSDKNKFTFYNETGGWVWFDELTFPNKSRWTLHQNGS